MLGQGDEEAANRVAAGVATAKIDEIHCKPAEPTDKIAGRPPNSGQLAVTCQRKGSLLQKLTNRDNSFKEARFILLRTTPG